LKFLIENTEEHGSFNIEYNPHKANCETAQDHEEYIWGEDRCKTHFETPEKMAEAFEANTLAILHWYRRSSVGFSLYAAPTMEDLVRWVMEDQK